MVKWCLSLTLACATLCVPVLSQGTREYAQIEIRQTDGELRGRYTVRDERPDELPTTPRVNMQFLHRQDVKDKKGRIVSGIGVVAWVEDDGARVWPFAIVPKDGLPNAFYASPQGIANARREPLGEFLLKVGETRRLTEMQDWGVEPFVLELIRVTR